MRSELILHHNTMSAATLHLFGGLLTPGYLLLFFVFQVNAVLGFNASVFAYGQTGSGKVIRQ